MSKSTDICTNTKRLSNVRYPDDIMLLGKTLDEIEMLVEEFATVGLELNTSKTEIITNTCLDFDFVDIGGNMVEDYFNIIHAIATIDTCVTCIRRTDTDIQCRHTTWKGRNCKNVSGAEIWSVGKKILNFSNDRIISKMD